MKPFTEEMYQQALAEILAERNRQKIDKIKQQLYQQYANRRWWHKFVPFTITITWRK